MGNASSDSLDHSFKCFHLFQTEQLSLASLSRMSPKRNIPLTNTAGLIEIFNNKIENNTNDQLPTLVWQNDSSFSSVNSVSETSKPIMNQSSNEDFSSDEEIKINLYKHNSRIIR